MPRYQAPTAGTRIAVWLFPAVTLAFGCVYTLSPPSRLTSPAFTAAKQMAPMRVWGVVFLVVGAFKLLCLLTGRRDWLVVAMCAGMALYGTWATFYTRSIWLDSHTSFGAPILTFGWAIIHIATLATLTNVRLLRRYR